MKGKKAGIVSSDISVIAPSLGKRFSGINASMIAVLPELDRHISIAVIGFHLPPSIPHVGFDSVVRRGWCGPWRIWHARRNVEMLVGLILRRLLRLRFLLVFTSAAQRRHSWITHLLVNRMDALIAPTRAAASFLDRPVTVVSHGVDSRVFYPPLDRRAEWASREVPGRYGIGVFGRIRPQKGTEEFVEAMIRVLPQREEWSAVLIGQITEEYRSFGMDLKSRLRKAGLEERVRFIGFLNDPSEIPGWYRALSLVVCPSHVEGFGLTCLEAMASGCPVVATRTGAWPELIDDDRDGYLVPCRDAEALADAVLRMTMDPARVHEMGLYAREKVISRYRIENEAAGIMDVYRSLFAARHQGIIRPSDAK